MSKYWERKYTFFKVDEISSGMFLRTEYKTQDDKVSGYEQTISHDMLLETLCDIFGISIYEIKEYLEVYEKEKE